MQVITRPAWLIALPVALSYLVWSIQWPHSVRRGYLVSEHLGLSDLIVLVVWYGLLGVTATFGWTVGHNFPPITHLNNANDEAVYKIFTWTGAIGVGGIYALAELKSPGVIAHAIAHQQFNQIRNAVPKAPGLSTLRYATIVSGAIAIHRRFLLKEARRVHLVNMALLLLNVLVASRLALLMSLLLFLGLAITRSRHSIRFGQLLTIALLALSVLTIANYSRNANFYRQTYGTDNALTMILGETVAYVGSPFQVSVGTAAALTEGIDPAATTSVASSARILVTPTFASSGDALGNPAQVYWYRSTVSIDDGLTTNSSLAAEFGTLGSAAFPVMALICLVAGTVMGHLFAYKSYMALGSSVLGYCFIEVWRIYLFNAGIVWFLLIALTAACAIQWSPSEYTHATSKVRVAGH